MCAHHTIKSTHDGWPGLAQHIVQQPSRAFTRWTGRVYTFTREQVVLARAVGLCAWVVSALPSVPGCCVWLLSTVWGCCPSGGFVARAALRQSFVGMQGLSGCMQVLQLHGSALVFTCCTHRVGWGPSVAVICIR